MNGDQKSLLKTQANLLKARANLLKANAETFARASDALARYLGQRVEYEKKRAALISQLSQMKPIRVSTTVKYGAVEDEQKNSEIIKEKKTESVPEVCLETVCELDEPDDIPETPRGETEAERIVREGTANEERLKFLRFYLENADVIWGVEFCATLQFSTCLLCAAMDGFIWKNPEEIHLVPALPMHENCRCILLPVTDMHEINSSKRPAEASDFWHDAAVRYAKRFPDKRWDSLAPSTKLKYYYEEQKLFEQETGHPAFDEVPQNMNFSEWLRTRPEMLQRRYLGDLRAKLFREYNLNLIDFVDQSAWTLYSAGELISKYVSSPRKQKGRISQ